MIRLIVAIILLAMVIVAPALAQLTTFGVGSASRSGGGGGTNLILLVDASSHLLQTDAASRICLAGGC